MHRADRNADALTDLIAGEAFELEHGEDHPLLDVQRGQDVLKAISGLALLDLTLRRGGGRGHERHGRRVGNQLLAAEMSAPAIARGDAETDLEQPRGDRTVTSVRIEPTMNDQEHLLVHVLEVRGAHAHAVQRLPDELTVLGVHLGHGESRASCGRLAESSSETSAVPLQFAPPSLEVRKR